MATLEENILCKELNFNVSEVDVKKCSNFIISEFMKSKKEEIVVVNIGTDKCTGDSFAPFLGSCMEENKYNIPFYGTLENPIHAKNLKRELSKIKENHKSAFIIAVDSSVTSNENKVEMILIKNKPLQPGKGLNKELPNVGDLTLTYTVCTNSDFTFLSLQNARLGLIYKAVKKTLEIVNEVQGRLKFTSNIEKSV